MTPVEIAAHQAADRERNAEWMMHDLHGHQIGWVRDLYVRAFLAGAQWQQSQESPLNKVTYGETTTMIRAGIADKDTPPATGSTASPDNAESPQQGNPLQTELLDLIVLMPDSQVNEILTFIATLRAARTLQGPASGALDAVDVRSTESTPSKSTGAPIPLSEAQERAAKQWAADDRLWTTQETVEFNLRTFARVVLKLEEPPSTNAVDPADGKGQKDAKRA